MTPHNINEYFYKHAMCMTNHRRNEYLNSYMQFISEKDIDIKGLRASAAFAYRVGKHRVELDSIKMKCLSRYLVTHQF